MMHKVLSASLILLSSVAHADSCHWQANEAQPFIGASELQGFSLLQSNTRPVATAHDEKGIFQSEAAGNRNWFSASSADQLWNVRDIRLRFATAEQARHYLAEKLAELSEDAPEMEPTEVDGVSVRVFGPRNAKAEFIAKATGQSVDKLNGYAYVFAVGPTVGGVLLYQGTTSPVKLKRLDHIEILRAAIDRVKGLCAK
jgi:hypothetical protein